MFYEIGKRNNARMIALEKISPGVPNSFIFDAFLSELYQKNQIICIIAWCQTTTTIAISKTLIFFKKRSGKDFLLTGSCFLHPRATQICCKTLGTFKTHLASVPEGGVSSYEFRKPTDNVIWSTRTAGEVILWKLKY